MLTYQLDTSKKLYFQLYSSIKKDIERGIIKGKLPSKRKLSLHLKISVTTVQTAYNLLVEEGHIYPKEKVGYFVCEDAQTKKISKPFILQKEEKKEGLLFDFTSSKVNTEQFPFYTWAKLLRNVLNEKNVNLLSPIDPQGIFELRCEICKYLYQCNGLIVDPQNILIGSGTEYLLTLLIQIMNKNYTFGVENPGYTKIYQIIKSNDRQVKGMCLDEKGIKIEDIKKHNINVVHTTPSHHFPLGIVMPIQRKKQLLCWANEKKDRYIIEDHYDSEFRFFGKPIPSIKSIDSKDKVIYLSTFSNTLAPSLRIGYMILPKTLINIYKKKMSFSSCTVSSFEQYTLASFLKSGQYERHINRMRVIYKHNQNKLISFLESSKLAPYIKISKASAGLHLLITLKNNMDEEQLISSALKMGIKIDGLSKYYLGGKVPSSTLILNYSNIDEKTLKDVINALERAWL